MTLGAQKQDLRHELRALADQARRLIEVDGRCLPSLSASTYGRDWVAPFHGPEALIRAGQATQIIRSADRTGDLAVQRFLADRQARLGTAQLCYGYPLRIGPGGELMPLLSIAVGFGLAPGGGVIVRPTPGARLALNHRAVETAGLSPISVEAAVLPSDDDPQTLGTRLDYLLALLGVDATAREAPMRPYDPAATAPDEAADGWINAAILFHRRPDPREAVLAADLARLADQPMPEATAFGAWMGTAPSDFAARAASIEPLPLVPLPLESGTLLRRLIDLPVALVEMLPDSGRYGLILDLLASAAAAGHRVLYVCASPTAADHVNRTLHARSGGDRPIAVPLSRPGPQRLPAPLICRPADDTAEPRLVDPLRAANEELTGLGEEVAAARRELDDFLAADGVMRRLSAARDDRWGALFDPRCPLPTDVSGLAALTGQADPSARALAGALARVRDALQRAGEERDAAAAAVGALERTLAGADPAALRRAAGQVVLAVETRQAATALDDARERLARCPSMAVWEERFARLGSEAALCARQLLSRRFARAATPAETAAVDQLAGLLSVLWGVADGTAGATQRIEPAHLAAVADGFPVWSGTAEAAVSALPLATDLFDLVIVDEADVLPPALLPLLLVRAQRAVIIGTRDRATRRETDAFTYARNLFATAPLVPREHRCWTPRVACYLSEAFHDGRLRILVDRATLERQDTRTAVLAGIHWYMPGGADEGGVSETQEIDEALRLLVHWQRAGVLGGRRPLTASVVSPWSGRVDRLRRTLDQLSASGLDGLETVAVGTPDEVRGRTTDLLILLPGMERGMDPDRIRFQADDATLYHDVVGMARCGVHVVGSRAQCREAGGALAALLDHLPPTRPGADETAAPRDVDARARLDHLLRDAGLAFLEIAGGLRVFTVFGGVYDLVLSDQAPSPPNRPTATGALAVLTLDPDTILSTPDVIRERLIRLV